MTCDQITFAILNLVVLSATAVFIVLYWRETQQMKLQMVEQNRLSNKQLKGSKMPILDLKFEKVEPPQEIGGGQFHYNYDLVIHNKGNGPAFNVHLQRLVSETRGQKESVRGTPRMQLEHLQKSINIIGAGEEVRIHRERSDSYRSFTIIIRFCDVFKENYNWIFEGDRDGVLLKTYDLFKNN